MNQAGLRCNRCNGSMFVTDDITALHGHVFVMTCMLCSHERFIRRAQEKSLVDTISQHSESAALALIIQGQQFVEVSNPLLKMTPKKALKEVSAPTPSVLPRLVWCDSPTQAHKYDPRGPLLAGNRRCPECYALQVRKQARKKLLLRGGGVPLAEKICDTLSGASTPMSLSTIAAGVHLTEPVVRGCLSSLKGKGVVESGRPLQGHGMVYWLKNANVS